MYTHAHEEEDDVDIDGEVYRDWGGGGGMTGDEIASFRPITSRRYDRHLALRCSR